MSFSPEWEVAYAHNRAGCAWPWSDLVSLVMRYTSIKERRLRVLELGCGSGANIPFFSALNADYYALEGSATMVSKTQHFFPRYAATIVQADFTQTIPFPVNFDLIVDRASLTHNATNAIEHSLSLIYDKLVNGGIFIGVDWFSAAHTDAQLGNVVDAYTRTDISHGQFAGIGRVHFSDKQHLYDLFKNFSINAMEHKVVTQELFDDTKQLATWNIVAVKV